MALIEAEVDILAHQERFAVSREKFVAVVGGFGCGKSQSVVFRTIELCQRRKDAVIGVFAPTYRDLADTNVPTFEEVLSKYRIRHRYYPSKKRLIIRGGDISGDVLFRSCAEPEGIVGFNLTDAILDEFDILAPAKQLIVWRKVIARLRGTKDGTLGVATTPEGFRMTYDKFEKEKVGELIRAATTDNHYLPEDYVQTLYDQYDALLVKQYIQGIFVNINQQSAYYGFSRDTNHLSNYNFEKQTQFTISEVPTYHIGMDFNVEKMCAEAFVHLPDQKRMHFFDEIILTHPGYSEKPQTEIMCDKIKDRWPGKEICIYPDASGDSRKTSATKSDIAIIEQAGFRVYVNRANPRVRDRLVSANSMLGKNRATIDTDKCTDMAEDFEKCVKDKYGDIEKKDPKLTHSSDAGTYPMVYLYPVNHSKIYSGVVDFT